MLEPMVFTAVLAAYLVGSIPFALLLARRSGVGDLHRVGSGNIGAANVMRALGVRPGIVAAVLDIGKGAAGVLIAERLSRDTTTAAFAGLAAITGHIYPVWLQFRGGKGVATACGAFAVLTPVAVPPAAAIFFLAVWCTKYISVGSVLACVALPPIAYVTGSPAVVVVIACAAASMILFRHRSNLARVWSGTERRVGARA